MSTCCLDEIIINQIDRRSGDGGWIVLRIVAFTENSWLIKKSLTIAVAKAEAAAITIIGGVGVGIYLVVLIASTPMKILARFAVDSLLTKQGVSVELMY